MKKFVVIMISFLVLFIFLMLNYLIWDKENLLKQSASDRIEQDWLRGQNRTLQSTIDEHEATIRSMETEKETNLQKIADLEQKLRLATSQQEEYKNQMDAQLSIIEDYKMGFEEILKNYTIQWFTEITEKKYEESWLILDENHKLWSEHYTQEDYIAMISVITSIALMAQNQDEAERTPAFSLIKGEGDEFQVVASVLAEVALDPEKKDAFQYMKDGVNKLQITWKYASGQNKWAILDIVGLNDGKP